MQYGGAVYSEDKPSDRKVVAVGLLTEFDLSVLGQGFKRAYRIEDGQDFKDLLRAIDDAERRLTE